MIENRIDCATHLPSYPWAWTSCNSVVSLLHTSSSSDSWTDYYYVPYTDYETTYSSMVSMMMPFYLTVVVKHNMLLSTLMWSDVAGRSGESQRQAVSEWATSMIEAWATTASSGAHCLTIIYPDAGFSSVPAMCVRHIRPLSWSISACLTLPSPNVA